MISGFRNVLIFASASTAITTIITMDDHDNAAPPPFYVNALIFIQPAINIEVIPKYRSQESVIRRNLEEVVGRIIP